MSDASRNKAAAPSFSIASLFLVVAVFAVCFAVTRVVWLLGVLMIAATLPALVAVALACSARASQRAVRPLTLFFTVSAITFVLLAWWGIVGWILGMAATYASSFTELLDPLLGGIDDVALLGNLCGLALGMFAGLFIGLDLVLFAPVKWSNGSPSQTADQERSGPAPPAASIPQPARQPNLPS